MPHHQATAHGYLIRKLTNPAQWQNSANALAALQRDPAWPAGTSFGVISVMQNDNNVGTSGDTVIMTVHTSGPSAATPAHANVLAVAGLVDASGLTQVIAGLANHWCCYSDQ